MTFNNYKAYSFLSHLSWKLICAFLVAFCLSVRLTVHLSVTFFTFSLSFPEPLGQFQPNLAQNILWLNEVFFSNDEGPCSSPRGDNNEITKILWQNLKNVFSRITEPIITEPISTKLSKNIWDEGDSTLNKQGPYNSQKGDNVFFLSWSMLWYNHIGLLIGTGFSSEQCDSCAFCCVL